MEKRIPENCQPDQQFIKRLYEDLKSWEGALNEEAELFTGETLLAREEELHQMNKEVDCWTDVAVKIFSRHQSEDGSRWPQHEVMLQFNTEVDRLHQQYHLRIIGENGVAKGIIDLVNPIETWCNKLNAVLNGGEMLLDSDWIRLSNLLREDWIDHLTASLALIGSTQRDSARLSGQANNPVNVEEFFKKTVKWLSATTNGIDNEDAKIVGRVSRLHSAMIRWMITVLLRLTPDMEDKELEEIDKQANGEEVDASLGGILLQAVPEEICNRAQQLFAQLREFSFVLTNCCSDLVIDLMQERRDQGDEHADMAFKDLKRLAVECDGWIRTACLLVQDVMGEGFEKERLPRRGLFGGKNNYRRVGHYLLRKVCTKMHMYFDKRLRLLSFPEAPEKIEQIEGSAVNDAEEVRDKPQNLLPVTGDCTPVNETAKETSEGASIKESEGDHEVEGTNQTTEESRMHVLGHDDNVKTKTLEELPADQEVEFLTVIETDGQQPVRSPSPDTRKALEALAAVERLQVQLLETEERAQAAEERAIQAEAELKQALERIRALERSASRASASTGDGSQTPTDKATGTSTVKRPNTQGSSAQQPPRSTSQQSSRPSTRASSRKK